MCTRTPELVRSPRSASKRKSTVCGLNGQRAHFVIALSLVTYEQAVSKSRSFTALFLVDLGGPKHGPHSYISYRGKTGKTTGYYVPQHLEAQIRQGVNAWSQLQDCLRELAALKRRASSRSSKKITTYFATAFRLWSKRATPYGLESVMNTPQLVESLGCF